MDINTDIICLTIPHGGAPKAWCTTYCGLQESIANIFADDAELELVFDMDKFGAQGGPISDCVLPDPDYLGALKHDKHGAYIFEDAYDANAFLKEYNGYSAVDAKTALRRAMRLEGWITT